MAAKIDHDDLTACPICFEQFTSPKRLPCHHTFCHPCLKSYIITHLGGEGKRGQDFPCPVCRQVVSIVDNTLSLETIADTFPDNQLIASLIERSTGTEKTQKEQLCGPCSRDNKELIATHWCKYCLEAICNECTTFHKRFDPSRHQIIPIEEMVKEKSTVLLDVDEPCMVHAGEVLKVYCVNHKELCCVICLATLHRKCEHFSTFDEMIKDSEETFEHFDNKLSEIDKKSDELKTKTEKNLNNLNGRHAEITKTVSSAVQKAKDKLDQLQTKFDLEFQQKHKEESMKLTERKDRIEIFQNNVRKGQKLLHALREHGSPKQLFITKEKLRQQLRSHVKTLEKDLQDAKSVDYTLKMDAVVTSVTQSVDSLAQAEIKHSSGLTKDVAYIADVVNELDEAQLKTSQPEPIDIMQLKVHQVGRTNVMKDFPGGTYLTDGRMVFCNWNERKLQAFDQSGKRLFETSALEHRPLDVCRISDKNILVLFDNQNYIKKYEVTNNGFLEQGTIQCKKGPMGLAVSKNEIIVGYEEEVDILFLEGSFKKMLTTRERDGLHSYVTVSMAGNIFYTSGNKVFSKTLEGKEITSFFHTKLRRPSGMTMDKSGNVYVCGYNSQNLCVFSPDGSKMKILIESIKNPYKIEFNPQGTGFFVTSSAVGAYIYEMKK